MHDAGNAVAAALWRGLLGLALLRCLAPTMATCADYATQRFGLEQGLSHNAVMALAQDREGYLWFATQDGLDRFDGRRASSIDSLAGSSLRGGRISALAADQTGGLWIGLRSGLLHRDRLGLGQRIELPAATEGGSEVLKLLQRGSQLWVGRRSGLYRVTATPQGGFAVHATALRGEIRALHDAGDALWVLQRESGCHLLQLRPEDAGVEASWPAPCLHALALRDDALIVDAHSVWRIGDPLPPEPVSVPPLHALHWQQGLVLAGLGGARWLSSEGRVDILWPPPPRLATGRPAESILAAMVDTEGALWLGSYDGAYRLDPQALALQRFGRDTPLDATLRERQISTLLWHRQRWWIGSFGDGVLRWDPESARLDVVPTDPQSPSWSCGEFVWSLVAQAEGVLLNGECLLDETGVRWLVDGAGEGAISRAGLLARDGRTWLATASGLDELRGRERQRRLAGSFEAIAEDQQGDLWLGATITAFSDVQRGLWRYRPGSGEAQHFALPNEADVFDLLPQGDRVWIASNLGLLRLDPGSGTVSEFPPPQAAAGRVAYSLSQDAGGLVWIGTNRGLLRFDPDAAEAAFRLYDARDGLPLLEFNRRSRARGAQAALLLGGAGGIVRFQPAGAGPAVAPPRVLLSNIETLDQQGRRRSLSPAADIRLDADNAVLSLEFAAPAFRRAAHLAFRYRLHGIDPEWIQVDAATPARYPKLPAGRYRFEAQAGDPFEARWGPPAQLLVEAYPPWYRQAWFVGLLALVLLAVAMLGHRLRVAQLLAMERMRSRIAADLHDELGSELAAIGVSADLLRRRAEGDSQGSRLLELAESARRASESVRDVVWYVNPDKDRLCDLGDRLQALAQRLFVDLDLRLRNGWRGDASPLPMRLRRELHLFCREAFTNILRHAGAQRVDLGLDRDGNVLTLTIKDDGRGFDPAAQHSGSGLHNLRRRAIGMGAELEIDSAPGAGTRLCLRLTQTRPAALGFDRT